jgi:uncharacterized DUF497 family protein
VTVDWDTGKSEENLARRGFDFAFAALVFSERYLEYDDARRDYGERRIVALGRADGIPLTVVFTDRVTAEGAVVRRIISARVSSRKERRRYAKALQQAETPDDSEPGSR